MYSGEAIQTHHEDFDSRTGVVRPSMHHQREAEAILLHQQREIGQRQWNTRPDDNGKIGERNGD